MSQQQHIRARSRGWILCRVPSSACAPDSEGNSQINKWPLKRDRFSTFSDCSLGSQKEITAWVEMLVQSSCIKGDYALVPHSSCWKLGLQLEGCFVLLQFPSLCFWFNRMISEAWSSQVGIRLTQISETGNGPVLGLLLEKPSLAWTWTHHDFYIWYVKSTSLGRADWQVLWVTKPFVYHG